MALAQVVGKIGPEISLPIILGILAVGVIASLVRDRRARDLESVEEREEREVEVV